MHWLDWSCTCYFELELLLLAEKAELEPVHEKKDAVVWTGDPRPTYWVTHFLVVAFIQLTRSFFLVFRSGNNCHNNSNYIRNWITFVKVVFWVNDKFRKWQNECFVTKWQLNFHFLWDILKKHIKLSNFCKRSFFDSIFLWFGHEPSWSRYLGWLVGRSVGRSVSTQISKQATLSKRPSL